jgi:lipid-A-disaccharide synthase
MVITYRLNKLTYWLVKRKAILPYAGLPNILAGEFIVPELLQDDATPANLAQALANWLDNKDARERLRERFAGLHESLAKGHDARVAQALESFLSKPASNHASQSYAAPDRRLAVRGR